MNKQTSCGPGGNVSTRCSLNDFLPVIQMLTERNMHVLWRPRYAILIDLRDLTINYCDRGKRKPISETMPTFWRIEERSLSMSALSSLLMT